ncbi:MAG: 30S ribosomal protein S20 [bacterium]|nr:30S ribosomal protein S20 [bacterium]
MPVTKTAKRALRGSRNKESINKVIISGLEVAMRRAKKSKSEKDVSKVTSLVDRAAKKKVIHKNKAARMKSQIAKLLPAKFLIKSAKRKK